MRETAVKRISQSFLYCLDSMCFFQFTDFSAFALPSAAWNKSEIAVSSLDLKGNLCLGGTSSSPLLTILPAGQNGPNRKNLSSAVFRNLINFENSNKSEIVAVSSFNLKGNLCLGGTSSSPS